MAWNNDQQFKRYKALLDRLQIIVDGGGGTSSKPSSVSAGGNVGAYSSPYDFIATYATSTTIDLTELSIDVTDDTQIASVLVVPLIGESVKYTQAVDGITFRITGGTLRIDGASDPFNVGDAYQVILLAQDKAYDDNINSLITSDTNPDYNHNTSDALLATDQALTTTETNIGGVIDVSSHSYLTIRIQCNVNDSLNVDLSVYDVDDDGIEYPMNSFTTETLWTTGTTDFNKSYLIGVHAINNIQFKIVAGTVGAEAGTITAKVSKQY